MSNKFKDIDIKNRPDGSNGCHDVLLMPMILNTIAILSIHGFENCCLSKGMGYF